MRMNNFLARHGREDDAQHPVPVRYETDIRRGLSDEQVAERVEAGLRAHGQKKVCIPTVFTAAPGVIEEFEKTPYAARLRSTGVVLSYICPLMYMNNPLSKAMPVITSSNKLRTYSTARYYTEDEIITMITKGAK